MYFYEGKNYPTATAVLTAAGLDAGSPLPDGVERIPVNIPEHDPHWEYAAWKMNADGSTDGIVIRQVRQYARLIGDGFVAELSPHPMDGWIPVPYEYNPYIASGWEYDDDLEFATPNNLAKMETAKLAERKRLRNLAMEQITVDVDGLVFDANKTSRDLMAQALSVSAITGQNETQWKLANNEWADVTLTQLQQAIAIGLKRHGEILAEYS